RNTMFFRCPNLGLPRRVVAIYLLFSLAAVAWLAAGVLVNSHSVLTTVNINTNVARLDKLTSAAEIEYIRGGKQQLQPFVVRAKNEFRASYCAIETVSGTYLAHTQQELVGKPATPADGAHRRWGDITGIRTK